MAKVVNSDGFIFMVSLCLKTPEAEMYKVIAFDAYGTLFDVYSIEQSVEELFPGHGRAVALMWRDRQVEYTRLVTMSDPNNPNGSRHYLPYWELTIRALKYVCKRMELDLTAEFEHYLMDKYSKLIRFEESLHVLKSIKELTGASTAILSNGNTDMLNTVVESNGLKPYLDKVVSVDDARLYKPAPQAYDLLLKEFLVEKEDILFVTSWEWDSMAAKWFGFDVFWVDRLGLPDEEIGEKPDYQHCSLTSVLEQTEHLESISRVIQSM
eukprot:gene26861-35553_t